MDATADCRLTAHFDQAMLTAACSAIPREKGLPPLAGQARSCPEVVYSGLFGAARLRWLARWLRLGPCLLERQYVHKSENSIQDSGAGIVMLG
jgi:hypothetical protein